MYKILRNCHNINLFTEGKEDIAKDEGNDLICSNIIMLRPKKEEESFIFNGCKFFIKMKDEADTY